MGYRNGTFRPYFTFNQRGARGCPCAGFLNLKSATDCRQLAAKTSNEVQKRKLLEMAEAWDRLAHERRELLSEQPVNGHRLPHASASAGQSGDD